MVLEIEEKDGGMKVRGEGRGGEGRGGEVYVVLEIEKDGGIKVTGEGKGGDTCDYVFPQERIKTRAEEQ